jgi:hypothetical protein
MEEDLSRLEEPAEGTWSVAPLSIIIAYSYSSAPGRSPVEGFGAEMPSEVFNCI